MTQPDDARPDDASAPDPMSGPLGAGAGPDGSGGGLTGRIEPVGIEVETQRSYLDYAMSVIVGRALPDVRDGLKPVHRRVLYVMHQSGLQPNRPMRKCARVVGT